MISPITDLWQVKWNMFYVSVVQQVALDNMPFGNGYISQNFGEECIYWGTKVWNIDINFVVIKKNK